MLRKLLEFLPGVVVVVFFKSTAGALDSRGPRLILANAMLVHCEDAVHPSLCAGGDKTSTSMLECSN